MLATTPLIQLLQPIILPQLQAQHLQVHILRLDMVHPTVHGNKWYKLKHQIARAKALGCTTVATYGGVWSNHIHATAAACAAVGLASIGYIRSNEQLTTATLQDAQAMGMQLEYISRASYKQYKHTVGVQANNKQVYYIAEGGTSNYGVLGAADILRFNNATTYSHILCPVGTGITLAGIVQSSAPHQQVIGINALKGGSMQVPTIQAYTGCTNYTISNAYHYGGFAKYDTTLIAIMNAFYLLTGIPTDVVYTGKMVAACIDMIEKKHFAPHSNILLIHTGGLQGNRSVPNGLLQF